MQTFIVGKPAYYWEHDNDRITQALMSMNQMLDEKRKEKERKMARDLAMLQNDPRQAAGPAGRQFMETYADDPQAVAFVQSLASQGQGQMDLEAGQSSYFEGLFKAKSEQGRRAAEFFGVGKDLQDIADLDNQVSSMLGQTPDPMYSPQGMMAGEVADRMQFAANQPSPEWEAFSGMDPRQRAAITPWLSEKKMMPMPKILGVGMEGIDPQVATAVSMGLPPEDVYNMYRKISGLDASAGAQLQTDTTKAGWEHQDRYLAEEERLRRERMERQAVLDLQQKQAIPGKAADKADAVTVKDAVASVAQDFEDQRKAAMAKATALPQDERKAALAAVPAPPPTSAKLAAQRAYEKAGLDPETAAAEFQRMWMGCLNKHNNDQAKATAELLGYFKAKFGK